MATELRCENAIMFAILDGGVIKVKCRSRRCGARAGVVIVHHFDANDGNLLDTKKYRDPIIDNESEV